MPKISTYKEKAADYKEMFEKVLPAFERELEVFQGLDTTFTASVETLGRDKIKLVLTSQPLPLNLFGLSEYNLCSAVILISGALKSYEDIIEFNSHFNYSYRNGDSRTIVIANKANTHSEIEFNTKTQEINLVSRNTFLENALRNFEIFTKSAENSEECITLYKKVVSYILDKPNPTKNDMKELLPTLYQMDKEFTRYLSSESLAKPFIRGAQQEQGNLRFVIKEYEEVVGI
ncbi:hypothetical protein CN918_31385 [Priestia megaterium]|nr:hypothetical protein CN918_31385 [Priestia megaterium]